MKRNWVHWMEMNEQRGVDDGEIKNHRGHVRNSLLRHHLPNACCLVVQSKAPNCC